MSQQGRKPRWDDWDVIWIFVILSAAFFIVLLWVIGPDSHLSEIGAAVFGTSGTIVAIALPAAELAGQSVTRIAEYWVGRFVEPGKIPPRKKDALDQIAKVKKRVMTVRKGSLYVLCSFFTSSLALLTPQITAGGKVFRLDYVLLGFAYGFLLIGVLLFFPFTWWVYRLDALEDAEESIRHFPDAGSGGEEGAAKKESPPPPPLLKLDEPFKPCG